MATHSSVLAWGVPWTEGPGEPQSMGSHRVRTTEATWHSRRPVAFHCSFNVPFTVHASCAFLSMYLLL